MAILTSYRAKRIAKRNIAEKKTRVPQKIAKRKIAKTKIAEMKIPVEETHILRKIAKPHRIQVNTYFVRRYIIYSFVIVLSVACPSSTQLF